MSLLANFADSVHRLGYAITSYAGDYGDDIAAIAPPVFAAQKRIVFTLTIMGVANRIHPDVDASFCNSLLAEAAIASSVMGLVESR
jgi:DNA-binding IclR family transcriptional regulator